MFSSNPRRLLNYLHSLFLTLLSFILLVVVLFYCFTPNFIEYLASRKNVQIQNLQIQPFFKVYASTVIINRQILIKNLEIQLNPWEILRKRKVKLLKMDTLQFHSFERREVKQDKPPSYPEISTKTLKFTFETLKLHCLNFQDKFYVYNLMALQERENRYYLEATLYEPNFIDTAQIESNIAFDTSGISINKITIKGKKTLALGSLSYSPPHLYVLIDALKIPPLPDTLKNAIFNGNLKEKTLKVWVPGLKINNLTLRNVNISSLVLKDTLLILESSLVVDKDIKLFGKGKYIPNKLLSIELSLKGRYKEFFFDIPNVTLKGNEKRLKIHAKINEVNFNGFSLKGGKWEGEFEQPQKLHIKKITFRTPLVELQGKIDKDFLQLNGRLKTQDERLFLGNFVEKLDADVSFFYRKDRGSDSFDILLKSDHILAPTPLFKAELEKINLILRGSSKEFNFTGEIASLKSGNFLNLGDLKIQGNYLEKGLTGTFMSKVNGENSLKTNFLFTVDNRNLGLMLKDLELFHSQLNILMRANLRFEKLNEELQSNASLNFYDLKGEPLGSLFFTLKKDTLFNLSLVIPSLDLNLENIAKGRLEVKSNVTTYEKYRLHLTINWDGEKIFQYPVEKINFYSIFEDDTLFIQNLEVSGSFDGLPFGLRSFGKISTDLKSLFNLEKLLHTPLEISLHAENLNITPLAMKFFRDFHIQNPVFSGDFAIVGTLKEPKIRGTSELSCSQIFSLTTGFVINNLTISGIHAGDEIKVERLTGLNIYGREAINAWGTIKIKEFSFDSINFHIQIYELPLTPNNFSFFIISGSINTLGKFPRIYSEGSLNITSGFINLPFGEFISQGPSQPVPPTPERFRISIKSPKGIKFYNEFVEATLDADFVVLKETDLGYSLYGEATIQEGFFYYLENPFKIKEGKFLFTGNPFNPQLQIRGESVEFDSIFFFIDVQGNAQNPTISISSEPFMPLEDILSYLTFGAPSSQISPAILNPINLRERGIMLTQLLISRRLRRELNLRELEISGMGSLGSPYLRVGFQLTPKIYIRYTHDIKNLYKDNFILNYSLGRGISLFVERDKDGLFSYGLGFRLKF